MNRSAGRERFEFAELFHQAKTSNTPKLLMASIQNGAAIPMLAMIAPASAGPTARLILIPTLLAAIAARRSSLGTSCGTIACQAGASKSGDTADQEHEEQQCRRMNQFE